MDCMVQSSPDILPPSNLRLAFPGAMDAKQAAAFRFFENAVRFVGFRRTVAAGRKADVAFSHALGAFERSLSKNLPVNMRRAVATYLASASGSGGYRLANVACASVATDSLPLICMALVIGFLCGYISCVMHQLAFGFGTRAARGLYRFSKQTLFSSSAVSSANSEHGGRKRTSAARSKAETQ